MSRHATPERPLVSVLTPSFNHARWLGDNLLSVESQTYGAIEHVVMDGGSDDGSVTLLEARQRPSLIWRSEPDAGQSHALNKALRLSSGSIIGWLNSDDAYFGPKVIEQVVALFRADPTVGVVYGHGVLVNADGLVLQVLWAPPFSRRLLRLHDFLVQPAVFIRREILGGHIVDESFDYTMDYELWLRLARRYKFRRLDRVVAVDRHHLARKSYMMIETGRSDLARLARQYRLARGPAALIARKTWKIVSRLLGTTQLGSVMRDPVAFSAIRDGAPRLLLRQVLTMRARMATGESTRRVSTD